jgi:hypothetical protein
MKMPPFHVLSQMSDPLVARWADTGLASAKPHTGKRPDATRFECLFMAISLDECVNPR